MTSPTLSRRDLLALTLAAAAWGLGTVVSKRALDEIPALTLLPIQLAASLVVLAVLMRRRGLPLRGSPAILGRLGILNPGLAYALGLLGLGSITASLAVLLWAVEPLMILVLAIWLLREQVAPVVGVLSLVAVAGLVLLVYDPSTNGQWGGVALTLAGVACCATYTIVARRWIAASDSTAQVVFAQQAHALVFALLVVALVGILGGAVRPMSISAIGLLSAIISGVLYYAAGYWLYLTALRGAPASLAAISFYLIPVFGVAGGILLLGEGLDPRQWAGAAIVLVAVLVITLELPPRTPPRRAGSLTGQQLGTNVGALSGLTRLESDDYTRAVPCGRCRAESGCRGTPSQHRRTTPLVESGPSRGTPASRTIVVDRANGARQHPVRLAR